MRGGGGTDCCTAQALGALLVCFGLLCFGLVSRIAYAKCKNLFCVIKREHDYDCNAARGMRVACATCGVCATPNERHVRHVRPLPPGRHTQSESTSPAGHRSQGQSVSQAKLICCDAASGSLQQRQPAA